MAWTKEQYLTWLQTRGEPGTWNMSDCTAADELIRSTALANANHWIDLNVKTPADNLLKTFLSVHFGSVETDEFLQQIKAYPDWM